MENPPTAKKMKTVDDDDDRRNQVETNSKGTQTSTGQHSQGGDSSRPQPSTTRKDGLLETLVEMQQSTAENLLCILFADYSSSRNSEKAPSLAASLAKSFVLLKILIDRETKRRERRKVAVLMMTSKESVGSVEASRRASAGDQQKKIPFSSFLRGVLQPPPAAPPSDGSNEDTTAASCGSVFVFQRPQKKKVPQWSLQSGGRRMEPHPRNALRLARNSGGDGDSEEGQLQRFLKWRAMALSLRSATTPTPHHRRRSPPQPIYANWSECLMDLPPTYSHEESTVF